MNQKEIALAATLMEDAAESYGSRTCNDWSFPDNWSTAEKETFVKEYHVWNGDPEEYDSTFLVLPDFAVMAFLAHKIGQLSPTVKPTVKKRTP